MATPQTTVYDADQVTVALGAILCDGFQDGSFVEIAQDEATFTKKVGADGKVSRSKTLNRAGKVTITLMSTSLSNDFLSALHILDRDAPNGAGIVPLYIRDRSGRALYTAAQAWVAKAPDVSFDREATPRAWEIEFSKLERSDGGN